MVTDRLYGTVRAEGFHDSIADIYYRATISAGVGYYFIKNDRTRLSADVGPGYVFEKVGQDERDFATFRFGEKFEHKLNDERRQ